MFRKPFCGCEQVDDSNAASLKNDSNWVCHLRRCWSHARSDCNGMAGAFPTVDWPGYSSHWGSPATSPFECDSAHPSLRREVRGRTGCVGRPGWNRRVHGQRTQRGQELRGVRSAILTIENQDWYRTVSWSGRHRARPAATAVPIAGGVGLVRAPVGSPKGRSGDAGPAVTTGSRLATVTRSCRSSAGPSGRRSRGRRRRPGRRRRRGSTRGTAANRCPRARGWRPRDPGR